MRVMFGRVRHAERLRADSTLTVESARELGCGASAEPPIEAVRGAGDRSVYYGTSTNSGLGSPTAHVHDHVPVHRLRFSRCDR